MSNIPNKRAGSYAADPVVIEMREQSKQLKRIADSLDNLNRLCYLRAFRDGLIIEEEKDDD